MARNNAVAFPESLASARDTAFPYRAGLGMIPSAEWVHYFDDFTGAVASNAPAGYTAIIDVGATLTNFTTTASANSGGVVRITSDAASEGVSIYRPKQVWLAGRKFYMEARVRTAAATDTDLYIGLNDLTATTDPEDMWDTSGNDFIAFGVADGSATPALVYDKDNGGPVTNSASGTAYNLANDTWVTLAFSYNGSSTASTGGYLAGYVNGKLAVAAATKAQIPEDVLLAPFIGARGGNGAIGTIDVDYVRYVFQR